MCWVSGILYRSWIKGFVSTVICKYLLEFRGLPHCFVDCFLCCVEAFDLYEVPNVHLHIFFLCLWRHILKEVAMANVEEVSAYFLLQDSDGFLPQVEVFYPFRVSLCVWCQRMVEFHSSTQSCPNFLSSIYWKDFFFPLYIFSCFLENYLTIDWWSISELSTLLHWSNGLFLCQSPAVLVVTAL